MYLCFDIDCFRIANSNGKIEKINIERNSSIVSFSLPFVKKNYFIHLLDKLLLIIHLTHFVVEHLNINILLYFDTDADFMIIFSF
jgi:hypothetical protein